MQAITEKIERGERLSHEDGIALMASADILAMGRLAQQVKRRINGERVFFNCNCHINLTNVCAARCAFCAFSCDPGDAAAYCLRPDEVLERVRRAVPQGITEVHMVSGLHPDLPFSYYTDIVRLLKGAFPHLHLKAFTAVEIQYFAEISGLSIEMVLKTLKAAGLDSLPGGGAEVLSERVRQELCPRKASAQQWLDVMRSAHGLGLKSNATLLFGHIESAEEIVEHLLHIRTLQDATRGFQAFIPLPFHSKNTRIADTGPPTAFETLKLYSISRLMLDNIDHIKAYWIMTGLPTAQLALFFGADDVDGTVMDEKITHAAGAQTVAGLQREDLITLIRQTGSLPVQRDTLYNVIETY